MWLQVGEILIAPPVVRMASTPPVKVAMESKASAPVTHQVKKRHPPTHPPMAVMINEAIMELHHRSGSSLQAIKKFIGETHHLDMDKSAPFIRKYLRDAVQSGILLHPKGKGATGSFKLTKKGKIRVMGEHSPHIVIGARSKGTKTGKKRGASKVKKPVVKRTRKVTLRSGSRPMRMNASVTSRKTDVTKTTKKPAKVTRRTVHVVDRNWRKKAGSTKTTK